MMAQLRVDFQGRRKVETFSWAREEVYLHAYETVGAAHQGLDRYLTFYNQTRPHQALDGQTPDQVYYENRTTQQTAA